MTRMTELSRAYSRDLDAVRADDRLSEQGRRLELGRVFLTYRDRQTALITEAEQEAERAAEAAGRDLFGWEGPLGTDPAAVLVARRDAADRAEEALKVDDGLKLLRRALRAGDEQQARESLRVAWERCSEAAPQWAAVVEEYLAARPDRQPAADRLMAAQAAMPTEQDRARLTLAIRKPTELGDVGDVAAWVDRNGRPESRSAPAGWLVP